MKLILVLILSLAMISCSSDGKGKTAANALCSKSTLNLSSYKPKRAKTISLPSNPNKSDDDEVAKDGIYILKSSTVHVHDLGQPVPDEFETKGPEFLQFSIIYRAASQSSADKESNTASFNGSVNCLSGLMPGHAGNISYTSNVPTSIEVKDLGTNFISKTVSAIEFGYQKDRSMKITSSPITDKSSVDKIEKINTSDNEVITNIYRSSPTAEVYQLQSRVTQGDVILTVINEYTRCVDPNEEDTTDEIKEKRKDRTQEETDKLEEEYKLCMSRVINLKSK